MKPARKRGGCWRWIRLTVRSCRILLLSLTLALVCAFIWFNQVGLPRFVKDLVQVDLQARGLKVRFEGMRWEWFRGIVTDELTLAPAADRIGPTLFLQSADLNVDLAALRAFEFRLKSIELFGGQGHWLLAPTNQPARDLRVTGLGTKIDFLPADVWRLAHFDAEVQGVRLQLAGTITNASLLAGPTRPKRPPDGKPGPRRDRVREWEHRLHQWLARLEPYEFRQPPKLEVQLSGDARAEGPWEAVVRVRTPAFTTAGLSASQLALRLQAQRPADTNTPVKLGVSGELSGVESPQLRTRLAVLSGFATLKATGEWNLLGNLSLSEPAFKGGEAAQINLDTRAGCDAFDTNQISTTVSATAAGLRLDAIASRDARATLTVEGRLRDRQVAGGSFKARLLEVTARQGAIGTANVEGRFTTNRVAVPGAAALAGTFWDYLLPWSFALETRLEQVADEKLNLPEARVAVDWAPPQLTLTNLSVRLPSGELSAGALLDALARDLTWNSRSRFAVHQIAHLLGPRNERYLGQYSFAGPTHIETAGRLTFPAWTNRHLNWRTNLEPTLRLAARIEADAGSYRGVDFLAAGTDLHITNQVLHLPNLLARRPEGAARLSYTTPLNSPTYHFRVDSLVDPRCLAPLLSEKGGRETLALLDFKQPPAIKGEVWGNWRQPERTGFYADLNLTNAAFRAEPWARVAARLDFTNQLLHVTRLEAERPDGRITAPWLLLDTVAGRLWLSNVTSSVDWMAIPRMIGPKTAKSVSAYQFARPPRVRINGSVPTGRDAEKSTDLHFQLAGGPFHWWKFNLPEVRADLHWVTNRMEITNLVASAYEGGLTGDLLFDFSPPVGNDFHFNLAFTNAGLRPLIADVSNPNNRLEGRLDGTLNVTSANTKFWHSWQGHGAVRMTNGVLWEIPVFGLFSPVLNTLTPGLGNSRAREATGTYVITNGIIYSRDLVIQSPPARLNYDGTVDFEGRVNARVEARFFKNQSLVTQLIDLLTTPITKVFEYKVTGTLGHPKSEPVYVFPKLLLAPFRPFQTLREIFGEVEKPVVDPAPAPPPGPRPPAPPSSPAP